MNISCSAEPCPVILNSTCVYYAGANLIYTGINTNDNLQLILQKIDAKFEDAGLGYIFQNGIIQTAPGNPVILGGSLNQNTSINSAGFTFALSGTIESSSFITTGGTSSQFVKGDGSLDSTTYQTAGNYITALTGDGTAVGPGSATFTLANTGVIANTYGSTSQVPVITVDAKGRVTNVTNTAISYPAALLLFSGDVTGAGLTGANVTLTLNTVNSGVFPAIIPLKFSVNAKGLVTGAAALTNLDIFALIGYTPVPQTRTLTINGQTYDLSANRSWTVSGLPSQTGNAGKFLTTNGTIASWSNLPPSGVTSVGLSMPSAFTVTNSPVTSSGTLTVTGAGTASQYVRGDGQLATLPSSPSGGGASISYYLNGSIPSSVAGYEQLSRNPVFGPGTNYSTSTDGLIAQFLTDAGDPSLLSIPAGAWLIDLYFNASSAGGTPNFYVELYKYDGAIFTLIASNSTTPEFITNGTSVDLYTTSLAVPTTTLAITDRLAIRVYVTCDTRTITLHTENGNLSQVITTFSTGISALNGLIAQVQFLSTGTTGTDFNISSATNTHTFNLPVASGTNTGKLSSTDWTTFNGKQDVISLTTTGTSGAATFIANTLNIPQYQAALTNPVTGTGTATRVAFWDGTSSLSSNSNLYWDNVNSRLGIGTITPSQVLHLSGSSGATNIFVETPSAIGANLYLGNTNNSVRTNANGVLEVASAGSISFFTSVSQQTMRLSAANSQGRLILVSPSAGGVFTDNLYRLQVYPQSPDSGGLLVSGKTAIGTTLPSQSSAILEVNSTSQGILPPRMTTVDRNAIAAPAQGLILYNTTSDRLTYRDVDSWEEVATTADIAPISAAANLFNYYNFY